MNWLKKLFATPAEKPSYVPPMGSLRPVRDIPVVEAKRIGGESVRAWCEKLEAEAERTGNNRMRAQAANIRSRFKA